MEFQLSPRLFNLYAEHIMRNTGLEETQAGIKIAGRNINNLRNADASSKKECETARSATNLIISKMSVFVS